MVDAGDEGPQQHLEEAVSSFMSGLSGLTTGVVHTIKWGWKWLEEQHPLTQIIVAIPVTWVVQHSLGMVSGVVHSTFFEGLVVIERDIALQTLPIPVGLSIYLLFVLWLITAVSAYSRIVALKKRIRKIESEVE